MKSLPNSIDLPDTAYLLPGSGLYRLAVMASNITNLRKVPRELFKNRRGTALLEKIFCSIGGCEDAGQGQGINSDHRYVSLHLAIICTRHAPAYRKLPRFACSVRAWLRDFVTRFMRGCRQADIIDIVSHNWRSLNPFVLLIVLG